jgi:hypothetical protein
MPAPGGLRRRSRRAVGLGRAQRPLRRFGRRGRAGPGRAQARSPTGERRPWAGTPASRREVRSRTFQPVRETNRRPSLSRAIPRPSRAVEREIEGHGGVGIVKPRVAAFHPTAFRPPAPSPPAPSPPTPSPAASRAARRRLSALLLAAGLAAGLVAASCGVTAKPAPAPAPSPSASRPSPPSAPAPRASGAGLDLPRIPAPVPVTLDAKTTAYLVLDMTSTICSPRPACVATLPAAAALLKKARAAHALVVYSDTPTPGSTIRPEVAPRAGDPKVTGRADKFFNTKLASILRSHGIRTVVIVGTAANGAVLYTAFGANLRGYTAVVAEDGISADPFVMLYTEYQLLNQPGLANPPNRPLAADRVTLSRSDLITFR